MQPLYTHLTRSRSHCTAAFWPVGSSLCGSGLGLGWLFQHNFGQNRCFWASRIMLENISDQIRKMRSRAYASSSVCMSESFLNLILTEHGWVNVRIPWQRLNIYPAIVECDSKSLDNQPEDQCTQNNNNSDHVLDHSENFPCSYIQEVCGLS